MDAIAHLKTFFEGEDEVAAVYVYGRYPPGPSFPDTDIELALLFPDEADEDDVRAYLERLSEQNPLGPLPGILMPSALNSHILPVVYEVLTAGVLLVDNDPIAREAFTARVQARLEAERARLLHEARTAILQARSLGLAQPATPGPVLPQPPTYLDPLRVGWRLGRLLGSSGMLETLTRDAEAAARDADRLAQVLGWFSNGAGAATGIAKAMLSIFDLERPPRRWQVFLPLADSALLPMDLALELAAMVEVRWQVLTSTGLLSAERLVARVRGFLPAMVAFARQAAWFCEVPGGAGDAHVH
ncbi:MAG: nucleotidyltransferase domain-containing protein [Armatimonadota bacterium]|nr:nucleotidyltransferase domain-containing protein [Armatimonadota bacterium]MDR7536240.1 nucleotidyltransferase domain-containing protein [Armatimonadota bacterium]